MHRIIDPLSQSRYLLRKYVILVVLTLRVTVHACVTNGMQLSVENCATKIVM